jgi:hypothetical protein
MSQGFQVYQKSPAGSNSHRTERTTSYEDLKSPIYGKKLLLTT